MLTSNGVSFLNVFSNFNLVQCSPFIMLCLGSIGMDPILNGQFYKEIIGK